jgi:hypothetical protein
MTGGGHGCSTLRPVWGRAGMRLPCMVIVLSLLACRTLSLVSNFPANSPLQSMASALGSAGASLHLSRRSTPSRLLIFRSDGEYVAQESSKRRQRRKGWHRVVTRFLRRRQNSDDYAVDDRVRASSPMHMSLQTEQDLVDPRLPLFMDKVENDTDFSGFIRAGFSSLTPQELMIDLHHHQNSTADPLDRMKDKRPVDETAVPSVSGTSSAGIYGSISLDALSPEKLGTTVRPAQSPLDSSPQPSYFDPTLPNRKRSTKKREFWARMTQKWFRNFLLGIIHRRSVVPPHGLAVEAHTRGRFGGLNSLGQFRCDATIQFDRVTFPNIRLSGGGTLMTKRLLVNLLAFGNNSWSSGRPRYERPFEIIATNCTFTEDDLWASSCIRNGLSNLLVRILNNAGVSTVQVKVTAVKILVSLMKAFCSLDADLWVREFLTC